MAAVESKRAAPSVLYALQGPSLATRYYSPSLQASDLPPLESQVFAIATSVELLRNTVADIRRQLDEKRFAEWIKDANLIVHRSGPLIVVKADTSYQNYLPGDSDVIIPWTDVTSVESSEPAELYEITWWMPETIPAEKMGAYFRDPQEAYDFGVEMFKRLGKEKATGIPRWGRERIYGTLRYNISELVMLGYPSGIATSGGHDYLSRNSGARLIYRASEFERGYRLTPERLRSERATQLAAVTAAAESKGIVDELKRMVDRGIPLPEQLWSPAQFRAAESRFAATAATSSAAGDESKIDRRRRESQPLQPLLDQILTACTELRAQEDENYRRDLALYNRYPRELLDIAEQLGIRIKAPVRSGVCRNIARTLSVMSPRNATYLAPLLASRGSTGSTRSLPTFESSEPVGLD